MKFKILGVLVAVLAMFALGTTSASASQSSPEHSQAHCYFDDRGPLWPAYSVCIGADYDTVNDGHGVRVWDIQIYCTAGNFESSPAINGHFLKVWNSDNVTKWSRGDADSNVYGSSGDCYRHWNVDIAMPASGAFSIIYDFNAYLNNQPDPGEVTVGYTFYA